MVAHSLDWNDQRDARVIPVFCVEVTNHDSNQRDGTRDRQPDAKRLSFAKRTNIMLLRDCVIREARRTTKAASRVRVEQMYARLYVSGSSVMTGTSR